MKINSVKGGDKLTKKLADLKAKMGNNPIVKVGFMAGATYDDKNNTPVAMVAAIQEFGTTNSVFNIPPRPFFRNMIADHKDEWPKETTAVLKSQAFDVVKTLDLMGESIGVELKASIAEGDYAALSPVTVMLRDMRSQDQSLTVTFRTVLEAIAKVQAGDTNHGASTKALDDTGHMLNSVTHKVIT
jgi:hypothetical protein